MAFVVIKNIKPDPVRAGFFGAVEKYFVFFRWMEQAEKRVLNK